MTVTLGLKQQNRGKLARMLEHVSDPTHPSYGDFLTSEQVSRLMIAVSVLLLYSYGTFAADFDHGASHFHYLTEGELMHHVFFPNGRLIFILCEHILFGFKVTIQYAVSEDCSDLHGSGEFVILYCCFFV